MARVSNINGKVQVLNSGASDITELLGWIDEGSIKMDNGTESFPAVNNGADLAYNLDGIFQVETTLSVRAFDFKALQLMGTYAESGTWSVTLDDSLPTHTFRVNETASTYIEATTVKWDSVAIKIAKGSPLEMEFGGLALVAGGVSGTLDPDVPSDGTEPLDFPDMYAKLNDTAIGSVDSLTINYQRSAEAFRGVENTSAGDRRKNTEILEGVKRFTFDAVIEITDSNIAKEFFGDASFPLAIQDSRSDITLTAIAQDTTKGQVALTGVRIIDYDKSVTNEDGIQTVAITGTARAATITGTLS